MQLAERIFKRIDYVLTSPYGWRTHPISKKQSFHYGVDFGTKLQKWEQYALEDGFIVNCGVDRDNGGAIFAWVEYPRLKLRLLHYHLDKLFVVKSQKVNHDTVIGLTGTTGYSTAIHLHLGVKKKNNLSWSYINPMSVDYKPYTSDLIQDGMWGTEVTKALQKYLGTGVDGIISGQFINQYNKNIYSMRKGLFGSQMVKELQKQLGVKVDGYLGTNTIKALQKQLRLEQTGYVLPKNDPMVLEMQRRLSEGWLL